MKIYRSERDKKIFGLCGGLAEAFNIDVTLLRLVVVVLAFFSAGTVIFVYLAASLVFPKEPINDYRTHQPPPYESPYHTGDDSYRYHAQGTYTSNRDTQSQSVPQSEPQESNLDEMMKDIEKKALEKEIADLKKKLEQYEKGEK